MLKTAIQQEQKTGSQRSWRFGLRDKMRATFSVIAVLIISAVFVSWSSYRETDQSINQIVDETIPLMTELSEISHLAQQMLSQTPTILLANTHSQIERNAADFAKIQIKFSGVLSRLKPYPETQNDLRTMRQDALNIQEDVYRLLTAQRDRIRLTGSFGAVHDQIDVLHQEYRLIASTNIATTPKARQFLTHTNQFLVGLAAISRAENHQALDYQMERLRPTLQKMRNLLPHKDLIPIKSAVERMVNRFQNLAFSEGSLSALRRREIAAQDVTREHLNAIRKTETHLSSTINHLMNRIEHQTKEKRQTTSEKLETSQAMLLLLGLGCVIASLILTFIYLGRSVLGRIERLGSTMRAIASGHLDHPIDTRQTDEIGDMAMDLSIFREAMLRNNHVATHDILTGLGNRAMLDTHINRHIQEGRPGAVFYFSLDGIRDIVETFGHDVADQVLRILANRLQKSVRPNDVAARVGGQRFVVSAPELVGDKALYGFISRIASELRRPIHIDELDLEIDTFGGISCYPQHGTDSQTLMHRADMAMRAGLDDRINRDGAIYNDTIGQQAQHIIHIRKDLKQAIDRGDFVLHYQPKMRIRTGQIVGVEALVRWNHPERGFISPADFIPLAESTGLIIPLGRWILREACRQAKIWADLNMEAKQVAVNISPVQFLRDDMVEAVQEALTRTGLPAQFLELEITEGVFMQNENNVLERLHQLRDMGVHLAIDDFGTGYSSLSYLKKLPVNTLKIDQSFVRNIEPDNEDARICRAIIGMAQDLGLDVVAEGIEYQSHIDFLNLEGCDIGQGYFISRPLTVGNIPSFLDTWKAERQSLRDVSTGGFQPLRA